MSDAANTVTSPPPRKPKRGSRLRLIVLLSLLAIALMVYLPLRVSRANQQLKEALLSSDLGGVRSALDHGADPDLPLRPEIAASTDHIASLRDLLRQIFHRSMRTPPHSARTPLMYAANNGKPDIIAELLRHGARINVHLDNGYTALLFAASKFPPETLEILIAKGADIHVHTKEGTTPLLAAAQAGQTENVRRLLAAGADIHESDQRTETALSLAAENHREETIRLLLAQGANERDLRGQQPSPGNSIVRLSANGPGNAIVIVNGKRMVLSAGQPFRMPMGMPPGMPPIVFAAKFGSPALMQFLWTRTDAPTREREGLEILCQAIQANSREGVRFLLDQHVPVNPPSTPPPPAGMITRYRPGFRPGRAYTPLHYAAALPSPEIARLLIAQGAQVNATDMFGTTPLLAAVSGGHIETVELLVAHGADVRATESNSGQTALMRCATNTKLARLLLEHGVDVNARDRSGRTALMQCYSAEAATLLLEHGADPNARDSQGNTPLLTAARSLQKPLITLLLQHGAKVDVVNAQGETPLSVARNMRSQTVIDQLTTAGATR